MDDNKAIDENQPTIKVATANMPLNEKEYARYKYEKARKEMLINPDEEHIKAFTEANKFLFEVEDKYRIGARLLLERAETLKESFRGLLR